MKPAFFQAQHGNLLPEGVEVDPTTLQRFDLQMSRPATLWLPTQLPPDTIAQIAQHQIGHWVEVEQTHEALRLVDGEIVCAICWPFIRTSRLPAVMQGIASTIKHARGSSGLTQEQVGALCGVTGEFIGRIERGHQPPSLPTLLRILEVLGLELFG